MIHHFHLEDIAATRKHHHLQLGAGAIDLPNVLNTIEEIGYTGFVTVELYTYEDSAPEAAAAAFKYLERWREPQDKSESKRGRIRAWTARNCSYAT